MKLIKDEKCNNTTNSKNIEIVNERGIWITSDKNYHLVDESLAFSIKEFLKKEKCKSVVDLGCGDGFYTKVLKEDFICDGFDGNPYTKILSDGLCSQLDLSLPVDLNFLYDWVLCLEVGEHIPIQYEDIFIDNIHNSNTKGIILSWATPGQDGLGHYNEREQEYIKNIFNNLGYSNDIESENELRKNSEFWWFKNNIMVFRKRMKIALCFSGQTRNVERGAELIQKHFLDYDKMDVFVHCWWSDDMIGKRLVNAWGWEQSDITPDNQLNIIKKLYNPVVFQAEEPIEKFDIDYSKRKKRSCLKEGDIQYHNLVSGWTGKYRVNELKKMYEMEKGFVYDIVINTRFDLGVMTDFHFDELKENWCYIPMWYGISQDKYKGIDDNKLPKKYMSYGFHDQIGFGSSKVMDVYSNAVNQIDLIMENTDVPYHPEMLVQKHLEYNNILVNSVLPMRWVLLR